MLAVWLSMYGICNVLGWQTVAELLEVLLQQVVEAIQVGILGVIHSTLFLAAQAAMLMRTATALSLLGMIVLSLLLDCFGRYSSRRVQNFDHACCLVQHVWHLQCIGVANGRSTTGSATATIGGSNSSGDPGCGPFNTFACFASGELCRAHATVDAYSYSICPSRGVDRGLSWNLCTTHKSKAAMQPSS